MSHSPEQTAVLTNYAETGRIEFDDPLEDYADGKGSCLTRAAAALVVAISVLGIAALMMSIHG